MGNYLITDGDVVHRIADSVHNPGEITATNMEFVWLAPFLTHTDDVNRSSACRPNIVVIDARCHYPD